MAIALVFCRAVALRAGVVYPECASPSLSEIATVASKCDYVDQHVLPADNAILVGFVDSSQVPRQE